MAITAKLVIDGVTVLERVVEGDSPEAERRHLARDIERHLVGRPALREGERLRSGLDDDGRPVQLLEVRAVIDRDTPEPARERLLDAYAAGRKRFLDAGGSGALARFGAMPGRRPHELHALAEDVACYLRHVEAGSKRPKADAAAERYCASSSFDKRLDRARAKGIYLSNGQGRPGGELTDLGRKLLGSPQQRSS